MTYPKTQCAKCARSYDPVVDTHICDVSSLIAYKLKELDKKLLEMYAIEKAVGLMREEIDALLTAETRIDNVRR